MSGTTCPDCGVGLRPSARACKCGWQMPQPATSLVAPLLDREAVRESSRKLAHESDFQRNARVAFPKTSGAVQTYWARRILHRVEAKDSSVPMIAIEMAREALYMPAPSLREPGQDDA